MKIKSDHFLNFIKNNSNGYKFIFLYGPNSGLVNLLFNQTPETLSIDVNDPFNVSKFNTQNLIDNPYVMFDTISTFSMTNAKRIIFLDLCNISIKKSLIDVIKTSISAEIDNFLIIIKADNLGTQNELVKYTLDSKVGILVPCYEETINQIKFELSNLLKKYNIKFSDTFLLSLSTKFSNDSSINKMEFDKLNNFLIDNKNVTEESLFSLINDNTNLNLNKIAYFCAVGDVKKALFFYEKSLDSAISPIVIIRTITKHFKIIEKILCAIEDGNNIDDAINNIRPPIFFKDKPLVFLQSRLWNMRKINLVLKRLTDTEFKCKTGLYFDKLLAAQLILSISVMAKNAIKP